MIAIKTIIAAAAAYYDMEVSELLARRRPRSLARARQVAMYLCRELTDRSYPEIGRAFHGRDHTTVAHGVRLIDLLRAKDPEIAGDIDGVRELAFELQRYEERRDGKDAVIPEKHVYCPICGEALSQAQFDGQFHGGHWSRMGAPFRSPGGSAPSGAGGQS